LFDLNEKSFLRSNSAKRWTINQQ